jgi:hypothetical protein
MYGSKSENHDLGPEPSSKHPNEVQDSVKHIRHFHGCKFFWTYDSIWMF